MAFELEFVEGWDVNFRDFDKATKERIVKKLEQLKTKETSRHLQHGLPYFVDEVGGYRITFKTNEETKIKKI